MSQVTGSKTREEEGYCICYPPPAPWSSGRRRNSTIPSLHAPPSAYRAASRFSGDPDHAEYPSGESEGRSLGLLPCRRGASEPPTVAGTVHPLV